MKKLLSCLLCCAMLTSMAVASVADTVQQPDINTPEIMPLRYDDCPQSGTGLHDLEQLEIRGKDGHINAYRYRCTKCGYQYYHWVN